MIRPKLFVYLVSWPDHRIIKAGVTSHKGRWRRFELRGATLHQLHEAQRLEDGWCRLEAAIEGHLASTLPRAFKHKSQAIELLGTPGGGYLECYQATTDDAYADALEACIRIMREHPTGRCAGTYAALMHGRTDGRTDADVRATEVSGSSGYDQIQSSRNLRAAAAPIGIGAKR